MLPAFERGFCQDSRCHASCCNCDIVAVSDHAVLLVDSEEKFPSHEEFSMQATARPKQNIDFHPSCASPQ